MKQNDSPYIAEAKENSKLLRLDKNVANSIDQIVDLSKLLGSEDLNMSTEDKNMVNSLIFFICHSKQNDLFGFGNITAKDFAAFINVKEGYLRMKHPNPVQLRGKSKEEIKRLYELQEEDPTQRVYDSVLENALYTLHHVPLNLRASSKEVIQEGKEIQYTSLSMSYILMEELKTTIINSTRGGMARVSYSYAIHDKFRQNLSLYFMRFDIKSIIKLRRAGLSEIYLYLKNLKDTFLEKAKRKEEINRALHFNQMCEMAGISRYNKDGERFKNPRDIKYKLNRVFETLQNETDLKFSITWTKYKKDAHGYYVPNIYFAEETQKTHEIYSNLVRYHERKLIFKENLLQELLGYFKHHNADRENIEENMLIWLKSDRDLNSKELAFRNAQFISYGRVHNNINKIVSAWLFSLPKINSFHEILENVDVNEKE